MCELLMALVATPSGLPAVPFPVRVAAVCTVCVPQLSVVPPEGKVTALLLPEMVNTLLFSDRVC